MAEHDLGRLQALRARMRPLVAEVVARAQEQGTLRADFAAEDVPMLFWTGGRVAEVTADVAPDLWRRYLGFVLDGLRADAATPLPPRRSRGRSSTACRRGGPDDRRRRRASHRSRGRRSRRSSPR